MRQKGLVVVFTGEGKGKTSAALGIAMRACGHKMYVSMVQFIKGPSNTGEAAVAERLAPDFEFIPMGRGFVINSKTGVPLSEHKRAAEAALLLACQKTQSGSWDVLILDEINNAIKLGLLEIKDVVDLIRNKPEKLHLILTGRDAHPDILALADMVTEMRCVKHPYDRGIPAQKGIDF
jgi:cob(I)alamin adenosyltransferase